MTKDFFKCGEDGVEAYLLTPRRLLLQCTVTLRKLYSGTRVTKVIYEIRGDKSCSVYLPERKTAEHLTFPSNKLIVYVIVCYLCSFFLSISYSANFT